MPSSNFFSGVLAGALIGGLACFGIFKFLNYQRIDAEYHSQEIRKLQSTNRIYSLKLAKEGWHWVNGDWVDRSVTKLSPKLADPDK